MVATEAPTVVFDAGPLIHLDELACLDLLSDFAAIGIPKQVWLEALRHRPSLDAAKLPSAQIIDVKLALPAELSALADSFDLDLGERAAIQLMKNMGCRRFMCDDAAARLAVESLGIEVHGTIGLLVRSIRTKRRSKD